MERKQRRVSPSVHSDTFLPCCPKIISFDAPLDLFFHLHRILFLQPCVLGMIFVRQVAKLLAFLSLNATFMVLLSGRGFPAAESERIKRQQSLVLDEVE